MYNILNYDTKNNFLRENPQSATTTVAPFYEPIESILSASSEEEQKSCYLISFPNGTRDFNDYEHRGDVYYIKENGEWVYSYCERNPVSTTVTLRGNPVSAGDYLIINNSSNGLAGDIIDVVQEDGERVSGSVEDQGWILFYEIQNLKSINSDQQWSALTRNGYQEIGGSEFDDTQYPSDFSRPLFDINDLETPFVKEGYYAVHIPKEEDMIPDMATVNVNAYTSLPARPNPGTGGDFMTQPSFVLYKINDEKKVEPLYGLMDNYRLGHEVEFPSDFTVDNKQYFAYDINNKGFHKFFTEGETGHTEGLYYFNRFYNIQYDYQIIYEESDTGKTKPYYAPITCKYKQSDSTDWVTGNFKNTYFKPFDTIVNFDQEGETGTTLVATGNNFYATYVDTGDIDRNLYVTKITPGVAYVKQNAYNNDDEEGSVHYNRLNKPDTEEEGE